MLPYSFTSEEALTTPAARPLLVFPTPYPILPVAELRALPERAASDSQF